MDALGPCDIAERTGYTGGIIGRLFKPGVKVRGPFFRRAKLFRHVVGRGFGLHGFLTACLGMASAFRQLAAKTRP